jgi:hypothetical protein
MDFGGSGGAGDEWIEVVTICEVHSTNKQTL